MTTPFWWKGGGVDQLNWFCACGPICEAKKKSIMKVSITNTYLDGSLNAQGFLSQLLVMSRAVPFNVALLRLLFGFSMTGGHSIIGFNLSDTTRKQGITV